MSETYANQDEKDLLTGQLSEGEMTDALHRQWIEEKDTDAGLSTETIEALKAKAAAGSWMAGNMLHLSGIVWDGNVGTETYTPPRKKPDTTSEIVPLRLRVNPNLGSLLEAQGLQIVPVARTEDTTYIAETGRPDADAS